MSTWLKKLLESKEERKQREMDEFTKSNEFKAMLRQEAANVIAEGKRLDEEKKKKDKADHEKRVQEAKKNLEVLGESMRDSKEPFVNVLSMGFSPENGIEVKLDYNEAFIRYLNKVGIKGANDDETIRLWLAHLNYDIGQEALAQDYLANGVSPDEMPSMSYDEMFVDNTDDGEHEN